jgi:hypothetical protein
MPDFLPTQSITLNGVIAEYVAASSSGNYFATNDRTYIHLKNSGSGSVTATINDPNTVAPQGSTAFNPDLTIVVPPESDALVGPLVQARFGSGENNYGLIEYDDESDLSLSVFRLVP